jgi:hypothetical protein
MVHDKKNKNKKSKVQTLFAIKQKKYEVYPKNSFFTMQCLWSKTTNVTCKQIRFANVAYVQLTIAKIVQKSKTAICFASTQKQFNITKKANL